MINMEEIRSLYLSEYRLKIDRLRNALERAGNGLGEGVGELYRLFHNIAGSGGSYGFSFVSDTAQKAKYMLKPLAEKDASLPEDLAEQLKGIIDTLDTYFVKVVETKEDYIPENDRASAGAASFQTPVHKPFNQHSDALTRKVLAVDGDESSLRLINWSLSRENMEIMRATALDQAMEYIRSERPDLIILAPETDNNGGIEFLKEIRRNQNLQLIPVILLSESDSIESKITGLKAGANHYLKKPFHPVELLALIRSELDRNKSIQEMVILDALTGAYSRRYIFERLREEIRLHRRMSDPLCLAIIDLDHFKTINDTYGHLAGDEVLRRFILFLKNNLRSYDSLGRYGGDEFMILMPNTSKAQAAVVLDRIRNDWASKIHDLGPEIKIHITFSVGLTSMDRQGLQAEDLIYRADRALYCAKDGGRNRICGEDR